MLSWRWGTRAKGPAQLSQQCLVHESVSASQHEGSLQRRGEVAPQGRRTDQGRQQQSSDYLVEHYLREDPQLFALNEALLTLLQDAANVTLRPETFRRNCVRCTNHKRWCKKPSKKVQNVCDDGCIKHGSDFGCVCDAGHTVHFN